MSTRSTRPLLIMFLGSPGSGKSYFARNLSERMDWVRLNGDSMRMALFGSVKEIERVYSSEDRQKLNSYTFGAIDYAVGELLKHGHSVVYDAHHNRRETREGLEKLAAAYDALPVVVRINTPYELALKRGQEREALVDQRQLSEDKMREVMDRHAANTDHPVNTEHVIDINGELSFDDQLKEFQQQLEALNP